MKINQDNSAAAKNAGEVPATRLPYLSPEISRATLAAVIAGGAPSGILDDDFNTHKPRQ